MTDGATNLLRHQLAAELSRAAETTGDARFRRAAGMLLGRQGGRRHKADELAAAEIVALVEEGHEPTHTAAARRVAKSLRERISIENTVTRLMRKYRNAQRQK